ncbi:MAG: M23 family metallopeptidase [Reyranella sp.]|uniref:M23 family metallopeptidase n=1 Tax=Reyranella sp. TaxID=1929291 RepID=UPI0012250F83|nr:M23 family metallopeptidase [Reyranella sp.]TAJ98022.1 MAG: M23 family metallopeptidase [Reyranella sp.]TBR29065.1 MAG: M23 family metallopeptidase [Reyranella sp.]
MRFLLLISLILAALPAAAQTPVPDPVLTPLVAKVLFPPAAVPGSDGKRHLVYELDLANASPATAALQKIEILESDTAKTLFTLERDDIARRLSIGGRRGAESADLGIGQFGVMFLHVLLDTAAPTPSSLVHRISLRLALPNPVDITETVGRTDVSRVPPPVLGPPLIGKGFVAADGCCDTIRHVRALLPLNGSFALAQRFAIDWEQIDGENRLVKGNLADPRNYTIYGQSVLAVADGTVVSARNDLPEQVPGALPANLPIAEADGNFVVLDIGGGAYVLYAHMQPGSVVVGAGARVKRGDILGKVGNTGNSQAPHLHLHVMDGPSPLLANGIPYVFDAFTVTAVDSAGTPDFDKAEATGTPLTLTPLRPPQRLHSVLPLDLSVVEFAR